MKEDHSHSRRLTKHSLTLVLEERRERTMQSLRLLLTCSLLTLFAVNVLSVLTMVFFLGFGKMTLSEKIVLTLIGETVAQAAAIFFTITRFIFPRH